LNPEFSDEELSRLYPPDYYAYQDNFQPNRWKEVLKAGLGLRIRTRDPKFSVPGRVLDLGCGSGWFLRSMREAGWESYGVEISAAAAELGRRQGGLNIFTGTLDQARFADNFFDYIRSNHSFEHISNPNDTLEEMHRILRPDGKLMIGVPNVDSFNAKTFGQYWWYLGAPVHCFNYSVRTLSQMLTKHRFHVDTVTFNSDYSGILGSLQIWLNRHNGRKSGQGSAISNPFLKFATQWIAKAIDLVHRGDAIEITAVKAKS
jgi:SAM-dependent methyltransferase